LDSIGLVSFEPPVEATVHVFGAEEAEPFGPLSEDKDADEEEDDEDDDDGEEEEDEEKEDRKTRLRNASISPFASELPTLRPVLRAPVLPRCGLMTSECECSNEGSVSGV
jgi:hypothetical protein